VRISHGEQFSDGSYAVLIEFSVGNFRSFKDTVTLSLVAADIHSIPPSLDVENVLVVDEDLSLLRSVAVYGANASGKSNLIAAIRFMRVFVLNSLSELRTRRPLVVEPFRLSTQTEGQPSHFEIVFLVDRTIYRYGFDITTEEVITEWLYHTPKGRREAYLFLREGDAITVNQRTFKEGHGLEPRTRSNAPFLSVVAQFNSTIALNILSWFENIAINIGVDDPIAMQSARRMFDRASNRDDIVNFIKQFDFGIEDILPELQSGVIQQALFDEPTQVQPARSPANPRINTLHKKYDTEGNVVDLEVLDLDKNESQGTQKLFILARLLLSALRSGRVLFIDEIDARLHSLLTRQIVKLFNSNTTNPSGAQLIFVTHDTNLLDSQLLRRDQIWFVEKSQRGSSDLYSLVEYRIGNRIVRNDASFEKDYIAGRYGAIPFIGDFSRLLGQPDEPQPTEA
jgi:uncharacterized protein